jgi:uncharacterized circularly permuted ATP-grasp superfamily protein
MKNRELLQQSNVINQVEFNNIQNGKFQYAITKNRDKLSREVKLLNDTVEAMKSDKHKELIEQLRPLVVKALEQDKEKAGRELSQKEAADIENSIVESWEKKEEYEAEKKEFIDKVTDLYDQENDFKFHQIELALIESLPLNDQQMYAIFKMIKE